MSSDDVHVVDAGNVRRVWRRGCSDSNTISTRRSSRVAAGAASDTAAAAASRRHRDSVISSLLRQEIERRKSLKDAADGPPGVADQLLPVTSAAFELPGIHISRIETMDFEDDELSAGSR